VGDGYDAWRGEGITQGDKARKSVGKGRVLEETQHYITTHPNGRTCAPPDWSSVGRAERVAPD